MQTLNAHFDGRFIVLDEPARLKTNAKVTVLAPDADDEGLANACARLSEPAFTAGMVSALDLLLGVPLSEVVGGLSLTNELEEALLGGTGPLGGIVGDVQAWEVGDAEKLRPGLGELTLAEAYTEGLAWAIEVCGALETAS